MDPILLISSSLPRLFIRRLDFNLGGWGVGEGDDDNILSTQKTSKSCSILSRRRENCNQINASHMLNPTKRVRHTRRSFLLLLRCISFKWFARTTFFPSHTLYRHSGFFEHVVFIVFVYGKFGGSFLYIFFFYGSGDCGPFLFFFFFGGWLLGRGVDGVI